MSLITFVRSPANHEERKANLTDEEEKIIPADRQINEIPTTGEKMTSSINSLSY